MWAAQRDDDRRDDHGAKKPEPGQQQPEVVTGRGEDDIYGVAVRASEMVSLQQAVALQVA